MQSPQHQSQMPGMGGGGMVQHGGNPTGMQSPLHASQQQVGQQNQQMTPQQQQQQNPAQPQLNLQTPTPTNPGGGVIPMLPGQQNVPSQIGGPSPQQQQQPQPNQQKEFNIVSLCRIGQETVQDIATRFQDVFKTFRSLQLPNGMNNNNSTAEKKVQEHFRTIRLLFRRLRILYEKCNDYGQLGMEYTHVESLIPLKDDPDHKSEPAPSEEYKKVLLENKELIETVMMRNTQLREVIDRTRVIIWEINTMLSMRRS